MASIARKCSTATVAALLLALGGLGGCGSVAGPTEVAKPLSGPGPTEVASITAYDRTVTFYSATLADGQTDIGISERGSAYDDRALVAALLVQKLTSQEIYLALAPEGATAPLALVAAQDREAAALDRSAEVRHAAVPSELVQKNWTSASQCAATILGSGFQGWYSPYSYTNEAGPLLISYPSGTACNETKGKIWMGTCNPGSVVYDWYMSELYGSGCGSEYVIDSLSTVEPGQYYYYYWTNSGGAQYREEENTWGGPGATFYMIIAGI